EARLTISLVVHSDIVLGDLDLAVGLVETVARQIMALLDRVARPRLAGPEHAGARQPPDLDRIVARCNQIGLASNHLVEAVAAIAQAARVAFDAEFLRRHAFDARALIGLVDHDRDIVQLGCIERCIECIHGAISVMLTPTRQTWSMRFAISCRRVRAASGDKSRRGNSAMVEIAEARVLWS